MKSYVLVIILTGNCVVCRSDKNNKLNNLYSVLGGSFGGNELPLMAAKRLAEEQSGLIFNEQDFDRAGLVKSATSRTHVMLVKNINTSSTAHPIRVLKKNECVLRDIDYISLYKEEFKPNLAGISLRCRDIAQGELSGFELTCD